MHTTLGKHVANFEEEQSRWEGDWDTLSLLTTTINRIRDKLKIGADRGLDDFFDEPVDRDVETTPFILSPFDFVCFG